MRPKARREYAKALPPGWWPACPRHARGVAGHRDDRPAAARQPAAWLAVPAPQSRCHIALEQGAGGNAAGYLLLLLAVPFAGVGVESIAALIATPDRAQPPGGGRPPGDDPPAIPPPRPTAARTAALTTAPNPCHPGLTIFGRELVDVCVKFQAARGRREQLGPIGTCMIPTRPGCVKEDLVAAGWTSGISGSRASSRVLSRADGELPGRHVPGLCLGAWACADRPRALPSAVLGRGPGPVPRGGHPRSGGVHHQAAAGAGDDQPGDRGRGAVRLVHRRRGLRAGQVPAGLAGRPGRLLCGGHPAQRHVHHQRRRAAGRCADRRGAIPGLAAAVGGGRGARPAGIRLGPDPGPDRLAARPRDWLLARRSISDPAEIAYYACYGPRRSSLADLAWTAGSRWHIEECFQQAKGEAGLDHYQVRTWRAWYAHITLSMLALAWLAASRARAVKGESAPATRA